MKRTIHTDEIKIAVAEIIESISFTAPDEIKKIFQKMKSNESGVIGRETLQILTENIEIAEKEKIPLCQDCGSAIIFLNIGQGVLLEGEYLYDAINISVANAYNKLYLRKSIVSDPLRRKNTGSNTPAFIHTDIVPGDSVAIDVMLKGGGSENMSVIKMFLPTDSEDKIIDFIEEEVISAGPNPCPPIFLGIGIGGTADTAMLNSKKALLGNPMEHNPDPFYRDLEIKIFNRINKSGIGPMGFGGDNSAAGVYIKEAPAHIASLPVALNMNCHSLRKGRIVL
ncbi:MAG: fumarate hydratase [Leptospirales bacterium]|nr:fumarate hydratase [Leptospirales bacterium]